MISPLRCISTAEISGLQTRSTGFRHYCWPVDLKPYQSKYSYGSIDSIVCNEEHKLIKRRSVNQVLFLSLSIFICATSAGRALPSFANEQKPSSRIHDGRVSGKFSQERWAHSQNANKDEINRIVEFRRFLQDYDLIGMPREKVITLLAPGTEGNSFYILQGGVDTSDSVELEYKDDKVTQWRLRSQPTDTSEWITKDVIWNPNVHANKRFSSKSTVSAGSPNSAK